MMLFQSVSYMAAVSIAVTCPEDADPMTGLVRVGMDEIFGHHTLISCPAGRTSGVL